MNPVVGYMRAMGIPLTRENYLSLAFPTDEPTVEEIGSIPPQFRPLEVDVRVHVYVDGEKE